MQTTQTTKRFMQMHQLKLNPYYIAESKQQDSLVSTQIQIKQSTCILNEKVISTLNGMSLKLMDQFTYLSSNISFTEIYTNICLAYKWNAIDRFLILWNSN